MSLKPEIAVIVGGTGSMGTVITKRLAKCGLKVIAVARTESSLRSLVNSTTGVQACIANIADDSSIEAIRSQIDAPVRMVIQGAGVATAGGVLTASTEAVVDAINIKVAGMMRLVRAVDHQLIRGSRLVAIGGHYGFEPSPYACTAGVANSALANLIRQMSWAYGHRGITSHLIAPGPVDTDRLHRVAADRASRDNTSAEDVLNIMLDESAIKAFTTSEQIAWAIETLLAPEADALAGGTLFMDAGRRKGMP